jgi:DNA excision repair protein ERCC-6
VTLAAKRLPTSHRLLLTGAPIQNRLVELWSLFDFVYPGRLGTLPVFDREYAAPIAAGAYASATPLQARPAASATRSEPWAVVGGDTGLRFSSLLY